VGDQLLEEVVMDRKIMLGAGALSLVLAAGAAVGTGGGVATATPIPVTLSGALTCSMAGSYIFNPGLTNAGGTLSTVTVKAKLTGCSGPGATNGTVTVTGGHLVATWPPASATPSGASPAARLCPT